MLRSNAALAGDGPSSALKVVGKETTDDAGD